MTVTLSAVTPEGYRVAMRSHSAGVSVITTADDDPVGLCVSSLASVSLRPPTVSFAVCRDGTSGRAWSSVEGGIVHLLHEEQGQVARAFSQPSAARFDGRFPWRWSAEGYPELADRLLAFVIRTRGRYTIGDHLVVTAEVVRVIGGVDRRPLVYYDGTFCGVSPLHQPDDLDGSATLNRGAANDNHLTTKKGQSR